MPFKFEQLEVWRLALEYIDLVDATVACQHIINRRKLISDKTTLRNAYGHAELLVAKLHTMRKTLIPEQTWLREQHAVYEVRAKGDPFDTSTS